MRLQTSKTKNAESFYIVESIYVKGKRSNKVVKKLGTIDQIRAMIGPDKDPYEWGREQAEILTKKQQEDHEEDIMVKFSPSKQLETDQNNSCSLGYLFLQKIYNELRIPQITTEIVGNHSFEYDLDSILSNLVYARALYPASKRQTYEITGKFVETPKYELHHIYRALSVLASESDMIQAELYRSSRKICERNTNVLYYDCTNYFFEIEQEDELRKYGYSKEHRPNPVVQMGLFMDGNGLPLAFSINPGNTNEQTTLKPLEKKILKDFGLSEFIVCTDAGLSGTDNRMFNSIQNRSFITTQSLKNLKGYLKEWALSPTGFRLGDSEEEYDVSIIDEDVYYNSIFWKEQWINENGIEQRLIVTYSPKYRNYTKQLRDRHLTKAARLISSKAASLSRKGGSDVSRYISAMNTTPDGEVAEKTTYSINEDAVKKDEKYDGFYAACTDLDGDPMMILKVMKGRWEIEECFRIMKTEFEARPVFLSREDRIKAHFLTCFMALLLYRILEQRVQKIDDKITTSKLLSTMQEMNAVIRRDLYLPSYTRTDITDALHTVSGFRTDYEVLTAKKMRKIIKESKKS